MNDNNNIKKDSNEEETKEPDKAVKISAKDVMLDTDAFKNQTQEIKSFLEKRFKRKTKYLKS